MILNNSITTREDKLKEIEDYKTKELNIFLIPLYLYDYLVEFKMLDLTNEQKWEYFKRAAEIRKNILYEDSLKGNSDAVREYNNFLTQYANNEVLGAEVKRLRDLSKKIAVFEYYKNTLL